MDVGYVAFAFDTKTHESWPILTASSKQEAEEGAQYWIDCNNNGRVLVFKVFEVFHYTKGSHCPNSDKFGEGHKWTRADTSCDSSVSKCKRCNKEYNPPTVKVNINK